MEWTKEDSEHLKSFRNIIDCDEIKIKEQVKQQLLKNKYIIHVLNNKELEDAEAEPEDYFGINILPFYQISPTQTHVDNFICYTVGFREERRYSGDAVKVLQLTFVILSEQKNIIDPETSLARTDLLGALIQDQFNWTNYFGRKIHIVRNEESVVDTNYACRTMIFEQDTDNNLVKTKGGVPRLANKELYAQVT